MINEYLEFLIENNLLNKADLKNHYGIACVIWNKDKTKILMQDHIKYSMWTIPVGKVDVGDSIDKTIKKEMKEEININVTKYKELFNWIGIYKRQGKRVKVTVHVIEVLSYNGTIKNTEPKKHKSLKWMTIKELSKIKNLSDNTQKYLDYIKDKKK